jgi:hypothetical protein
VSNSLSYVAHAILLRTQHFVVDIFPETERLRFSYIKYLEILLYYSHLFCSLVFLLFTSVSERNAACIFTDEMKNIRMWIIYVRICGGLSQEIYSQKNTEHGCNVKSKPVPLHHTRAEGGRRYNSYSFMISALDRGVWSGPRPCRSSPRGKDSLYPLNRRLPGPRSWLYVQPRMLSASYAPL